jgi:hypothetical protein
MLLCAEKHQDLANDYVLMGIITKPSQYTGKCATTWQCAAHLRSERGQVLYGVAELNAALQQPC